MIRLSAYLLSLLLIFVPECSFAAGMQGTVTDAVNIVVNIAENVGAVMEMVTGFLYLAGIGCSCKAVYYLKVYGEMRTMMASQSNLKQPITWFIVGAIFLFLPRTIEVSMNTVFATSDILTYSDWEVSAADLYFQQLMQAIFTIVRLVGLISFARGWFIIAQASSGGGGGQASTGKGLIHVFGGLLGMNIVGTLNLINNTIKGTT